MGHSVRLIVGQPAHVARFLNHWPVARAVELLGDWQAIPVDDALYHAIEAANPGSTRLPDLDVAPLGIGQALVVATSPDGALAYVETDYWGGSGGQCAMAVVDGYESVAPLRARGAGPINQALRSIGVVRADGQDEFDTIGLGERRSMSDYEPEGPVRLRASPTISTQPASPEPKRLPMWLVMILIAVAVGIGIMVAALR